MLLSKLPERYRKKLRTFYLILGLIALIVTLFFNQYFQFLTVPFQCKILNSEFFSLQDTVDVYYNDFDHNGFSEHVQFKFVARDKQIGAKYYDEHGNLIDQWNFPERWIRNAVFFADYDNDHFDEVYFFTLANDSLFLYAFDPRKLNEFFLWRQFIAAAPKQNPHPQKIWDLYDIKCLFLDGDQDGHKECYISLLAGFSLKPRGMVRFDIDEQKITARSPEYGAIVSAPILVDLNNDGKQEILFQFSSPPDNYHYEVPYRDNQCYLMVFDQNLNFFFEPIVFPHVRSGLISIPWQINNRTFIVSRYHYEGPLNVNDALYLFDASGRQINRKFFPKNSLGTLYTLNENGTQKLYVTNRINGNTIYKINKNLEIAEEIQIRRLLGEIFARFDLDGDFKDEFLMTTENFGYLIFNPYQKFCVTIPQVKSSVLNIHTINKRGEKGGQLVIQQGNKVYHIGYLPVPWYPMRHLIYGLLFVAIYGFLLGIYLLWQKSSAQFKIWQNLVQSASSGLCILSSHGVIKFLNGNFESYLNFSKHLKEGSYFEQELEENQTLIKFIRGIIEKQQYLEKEIKIKTNDDLIPVLLRGRVLPGFFSMPAGFMIEAIPLYAQSFNDKLLIWTRTVQKMAHDIKTPLAAIQFLIQSIKLQIGTKKLGELENLNTDFETIDNELNRIREMTKHFLRFTNLEKPNFQWISIKETLANVLKKFSPYQENGLRINLDLDSQYDKIWADPVLVEMALQAIIENAIDALHEKGTILISNSLIQLLEENFQPYVEIEITDNGPGIDQQILEKIFDPFFTTKEEGTGMGLTLARKIMEDHDGKIEIQSHKGKSTQVRLLFPYREGDDD